MRGILFQEQVHLPVTYKSVLVGDYIADFVIEDKIILELKAISKLENSPKAQAVNYLVATGYQLAILINFGESTLHQQRIVRGTDTFH